jgi:hypothetical protein
MKMTVKYAACTAAFVLLGAVIQPVQAHEDHSHHQMQDMATKQPIKLTTVD